jgi:hypothetical protein
MSTITSEQKQTIAQAGHLTIEDGAYVIIKAEDFERDRKERVLLRALARGEKEIREGEGFEIDAILKEADEILGNPGA